MGIDGLWEYLPKSETEQPLLDFTVEHGFLANINGCRAYRIGIDVSLWFYHARKVTGKTRNGELQMFFHRCCRLLAVPVVPLFVFDGPDRPEIKRGKIIKKIGNNQLSDIQELITAFGFESLTAPGEAEATLSQLNAAGLIDGILSDDVDCFLFGAQTVLRSVKSHSKSKYMESLDVYRSQRLEDSHFSRDELLLVALMRGGDYDHGITGCGITTAVNLRQIGFGRRLVERWNNRLRSYNEWLAFLSVWRNDVKMELLSNTSGDPGQVNRQAADNLTNDFPKFDVLSAYLDPEVLDVYELPHISESLWKNKLNLSKLAIACHNKFEWSTDESKILGTFKSLVWPGAVMRVLLAIMRTIDNGMVSPEPLFKVIPVRRKPKAKANRVSIQISTTPFIQAVKDGLSQPTPVYGDTINLPWRTKEKNRVVDEAEDELECFWVHGSIIDAISSQSLKENLSLDYISGSSH